MYLSVEHLEVWVALKSAGELVDKSSIIEHDFVFLLVDIVDRRCDASITEYLKQRVRSTQQIHVPRVFGIDAYP